MAAQRVWMLSMTHKRNPTTDAVEILRRRYFSGRPARLAELADARTNATVGRQVYELRRKAGMTQAALAKLVGTTPSVICRLENADYDGHSLSMIHRLAAALDRQVEIRFRKVKSVARK